MPLFLSSFGWNMGRFPTPWPKTVFDCSLKECQSGYVSQKGVHSDRLLVERPACGTPERV